MELQERETAPTLGKKLGDAPHVSGLAIRLGGLSSARKRLPRRLMRVAVQRGAKHYDRAFDPTLPPDNPGIPDEEIGIALCLEQHPYDLDRLRIAAQPLSSRQVSLDLVLTKMARGDENDLRDIRFLLQQEKISSGELRNSFDRARVPDVPEIQEFFKRAQPKVLKIAEARPGKRRRLGFLKVE
jgi:hypothetical protein